MLRACAAMLLVLLAACSRKEDAPPAPAAHATAPASAEAAADPLAASVAGAWRSAEDRARDEWRHPQQSLSFWGLEPGMTILEVQPGNGWWTEILAPFAHATGGRYYATAADLDNLELSEAARKARSPG